uniref:Protein tyrosine phosphatase type IVA 3 n=1 Tax=Periophthalmus magnuspinnatus TaxID=409849 RepID=A0A3B4ADE9_9GOBI
MARMNRPAPVEITYKNMRFLITHNPTNATLNKAPVLVALALIECGMKYEDAVQFIRQKRRGAFNSKQLFYLEKYRPKMRLRFKDSNGHRNNCCIQ